jgi:AcrR family transcriptional regulator
MMPDERRALILRAARDLFSQRSYADVSVADIAAAAGVSPPLIVFHFGSKRSLYLAVLDAAAAAIRAGLDDLPGPPSLDRLRAGVRFYAGYARTHRAGFLSLLRGGQDVAEAAALVEAFRDELAAQIDAAVSPGRGRVDGSGTLTLLAVRGYLGYVDAVIVYWLALPEDQRDQVSADMIADVAAGAFAGGLAAV